MQPNPDSAFVMSEIDRLSKPWRALVREYGFSAVKMYLGEMSAKDAEYELMVWRARRQAEWLSTNYVRERSMADAFERAVRG
jgi:hypothetical protein